MHIVSQYVLKEGNDNVLKQIMTFAHPKQYLFTYFNSTGYVNLPVSLCTFYLIQYMIMSDNSGDTDILLGLESKLMILFSSSNIPRFNTPILIPHSSLCDTKNLDNMDVMK